MRLPIVSVLLAMLIGCGGSSSDSASSGDDQGSVAGQEGSRDLSLLEEFKTFVELQNEDFNLDIEVDYWDLRIPLPGTASIEFVPEPVQENYRLYANFDKESYFLLPEWVQQDLASDATLSDVGFVYHCSPSSCPVYLAYGSDEGSGIATDLESLGDFLGQIDTPAEAYVWVWAHDLTPHSYKRVEDGFEVFARTTDGDWICLQDQYLKVHQDGTVELLEALSEYYIRNGICTDEDPTCICR